ncbi:MAG: response regulator [Deltaproteobacteria bacterium]|nr:response regulator [Deltaproteobacteria bacterium]
MGSKADTGTASLRLSRFYADSLQAVKCFEGLLQRLVANSAKEVVFAHSTEALEIQFYKSVCFRTNRDSSPIDVFKVSTEFFPLLRDVVLARAVYWPDPGDVLWCTNQNRSKRLAIDNKQYGKLLIDIAIDSQAQDGEEVDVLKLRVLEHPHGMSLTLDGVSERNKEFFEQGLSQATGIVLVSDGERSAAVSAGARTLACRPDALLFHNVHSFTKAVDALEKATRNLVVVSLASQDPVEMIFNFAGLLGDSRDLKQQYFSALRLAYVHKRVRRVCHACARSSAADPKLLERLPMAIRPAKNRTYLFGRGCSECGELAYKGTIGLDSLVYVDEQMRQKMREDKSITDITQIAYRKGARSLMEDGLDKVYHGHTSFEELFGVVADISRAFVASIASSKSDSDETPIDREINAALSSVGDEFFVDSAASTKGSRRVLLVEDDRDQMEILKIVFQKEQYEILQATNGKEALEILDFKPVDIVVCDLMMPIMNGEQFVKELRASEKLKRLPVLILTAVGGSDAECNLLEVGADDYCSKTVNRKVLLKRVQKLLSK